jgi:hypothetical protein
MRMNTAYVTFVFPSMFSPDFLLLLLDFSLVSFIRHLYSYVGGVRVRVLATLNQS